MGPSGNFLSSFPHSSRLSSSQSSTLPSCGMPTSGRRPPISVDGTHVGASCGSLRMDPSVGEWGWVGQARWVPTQVSEGAMQGLGRGGTPHPPLTPIPLPHRRPRTAMPLQKGGREMQRGPTPLPLGPHRAGSFPTLSDLAGQSKGVFTSAEGRLEMLRSSSEQLDAHRPGTPTASAASRGETAAVQGGGTPTANGRVGNAFPAQSSPMANVRIGFEQRAKDQAPADPSFRTPDNGQVSFLGSVPTEYSASCTMGKTTRLAHKCST